MHTFRIRINLLLFILLLLDFIRPFVWENETINRIISFSNKNYSKFIFQLIVVLSAEMTFNLQLPLEKSHNDTYWLKKFPRDSPFGLGTINFMCAYLFMTLPVPKLPTFILLDL